MKKISMHTVEQRYSKKHISVLTMLLKRAAAHRQRLYRKGREAAPPVVAKHFTRPVL